ncbi:MAG: SDR family oxidoreductase [Chloroflexi bacterium]|nr:SDR family oxidoreductase [Chloroflexota bacterium]
MPGRLEDKVALITGTGGAQGRVAVQLFTREGAKVVGTDISGRRGEETLELVRGEGHDSVFYRCDLAEETEIEQLVAFALESYGGLDIVYNNAARAKFAPFAELTMEDWQFTIRNEMDVIFLLCKRTVPVLIERGGGSIINVASIGGVVGMPGLGNVAHGAAKAGVIGLTKNLAVEVRDKGIRVNAIAPGIIDTPGAAQAAGWDDPEIWAALTLKPLTHKAGQPEDVVNCALYLASDESSYVTGSVFTIDDGWAAW